MVRTRSCTTITSIPSTCECVGVSGVAPAVSNGTVIRRLARIRVAAVVVIESALVENVLRRGFCGARVRAAVSGIPTACCAIVSTINVAKVVTKPVSKFDGAYAGRVVLVGFISTHKRVVHKAVKLVAFT